MKRRLARIGLRHANEEGLAVAGNWKPDPSTMLVQFRTDVDQDDAFGPEIDPMFGQSQVVEMPTRNRAITGAFGQKQVSAVSKFNDRIAPRSVAGERDELVAESNPIPEAGRVPGVGHRQRGDNGLAEPTLLTSGHGLVTEAKAEFAAREFTIASGRQ